MSRILTPREIKPRRPYCLADETVSGEPVCEANSLLTGKLTGKFADSFLLCDFCAQSISRFKGLQANSLRNRTGNFLNSSRELNRGIRELNRGIREFFC